MPPDHSATELDLRGYFAALRRRRMILLFTTVIVVGLALTISILQTPVYRAEAEVLLQQRASESILDPTHQQQNSLYIQQQVQTEIEVMRSRSVVDAATKKLGYEPKIATTVKGDTQVVVISADDRVRSRAVDAANAYAQSYIDLRRQTAIGDLLDASATVRQQMATLDASIATLDQQVSALDAQVAAEPDLVRRTMLSAQRDRTAFGNAQQRQALLDRRITYVRQLDQLELSANIRKSGGPQIVSRATRPIAPVSPKPLRDGAIALVLGVILAVVLAFGVDYVDDSIRTKDDLDEVTGGVPVLGLVPIVENWRDRQKPELISLSRPSSAAAEAYRALRTSLQFLSLERATGIVQLTSPSASEGKTTTLANLGVALARAGQSVLLVDCDLRRPRLHQFFGLGNEQGLTSLILREATLDDALQPVAGVPRLSILPSGPPPPNPSELLSTRRAAEVLRSLADHFDYVLVDSPPLLPVADARILSGAVDATVLVATAGSTTKRAAARAIELLHQVDAQLLGVVFNSVATERASTYGYGASAYRDSVAEAEEPRRRFARRSGSAEPVAPDVPLPPADLHEDDVVH